MTKLLKGAPVAEKIKAEARALSSALPCAPTLAIVRVGDARDDVAYENSIRRACTECGVNAVTAALPGYVDEGLLARSVHLVALDESVHGVIVLCPRVYDRALLGAAIGGGKDVDGAGYLNGSGYPPCTAQAVMETLSYYGCAVAQKSVVIIGRSPVVGAPLERLMEAAGARVQVCHSKTEDPEKLCRGADVLVSAAGRAGLVDKTRVHPGQTVIDVGINFDENGKLCGDVDPSVSELVAALSPVPGGVGGITPWLLALNTARAAKKLLTNQ